MRYERELRAISEWLGKCGVYCADMAEALDRFGIYIDLLLHYQKRTNLTGCATAREIVDSLIIDSLQILRTGRLPGTCADVGSGAGFPAIPLQIIDNPPAFYLIEPRTKRYAFLQCVCRELGFSTVTVRREKVANAHLPPIDFAISKAFAPIMDWLETARPWTDGGAQVACLVAQNDWNRARETIEKNYRILGIIAEDARVYARMERLRHA